MRRLVFSVREWIDRDDFEKLIRFCRYLGREGGASIFEIDVDKLVDALRSGDVKPEEVLDLVEGYDAEFVEGSLEELEKIVENYMPKVVVRRVGSEIVLEPNTYLGDVVRDLREAGLIRYDRARKIFVVSKPMNLFEVLNRLRGKGIRVVDETGIRPRQELPIKVSFRGELRPYQREALEAWRRNGFRGVISLPTGSGKTIVAVAALAELSVRTLIVAFTKEQMFQWRDKILEFTDAPPSMIGFFYSEEKRVAPITITTYQSAHRYIDQLSPYYSFLIIDEVHHLPAEKFRYIAEHSVAIYRMGLSATVVREDGKHVELFPLMGGLVYHKSAEELAEEGFLARFRLVVLKVDLTPEERARYRKLLDQYRALAAGRTFDQLLRDAKQGDDSAIRALRIRSEIRQLVHNASKKLELVKKIVDEELSRGSKILVFTQYVDQAKRLAEMLGALYITGELDESTRRARLERFRAAKSGVLVLTTVGDEGIDIPDANVGIIVAGTGSRRQYIQRLGRLLRPAPGKEARLYEVIVKNTFEEFESKRRRSVLTSLGL